MKEDSSPTAFERAVVAKIVEHEAPHLLGVLPNLAVEKRRYTGVGVYVIFHDESHHEHQNTEMRTELLGTSLFANIGGLEHGVGFILTVRGSIIYELEIFTHGPEKFPHKVDEFNMYYLRD